MRSYTAIATREEGWWTVEVEEVPGFFTQAKRLSQVPELVREGLLLFPEVENDPASAEITVRATGELADITEKAREARRAAEDARRDATARVRSAVLEMTKQGLAYRDIGCLLGISYQRAQKLAVEAKRA